MQIQVLRVLLDARDTRGQSLTTAVRLCGHPRRALGLAPHGYRRDGYAHAWCLSHFVMHAQCTRCKQHGMYASACESISMQMKHVRSPKILCTVYTQ